MQALLQEDTAECVNNQILMGVIGKLILERLVDKGVSTHYNGVGILREHNWGAP